MAGWKHTTAVIGTVMVGGGFILSVLVGMQNNIGAMQDNIGAMQDNIGAMQDNIRALQGDVRALQSDMNVVRSDVAAMQSDVAVLSSSVERLTTQQAEMDARLRTVEQAVVRLGTIVDERLPAD